jgi:hypothetical protein
MRVSGVLEVPEIIRTIPELKTSPLQIVYISECVLNEAQKICDTVSNLVKYELWREGINPQTNGLMIIGGKTHKGLEKKYAYKKILGRLYHIETIKKIAKIDLQKYRQSIDKIYMNHIVNDELDGYNEKIRNLSAKINSLERWNDCVEFEGKFYGLPDILDNIHRRDDCMSEIMSCSLDEDIVMGAVIDKVSGSRKIVVKQCVGCRATYYNYE